MDRRRSSGSLLGDLFREEEQERRSSTGGNDKGDTGSEFTISSCEFCVSLVGREPVAHWDTLQRCKRPSAEAIVASYFGIDEWKVAQEMRKHGNFDSALRCLGRRHRRSVYSLARLYGDKPRQPTPVKQK